MQALHQDPQWEYPLETLKTLSPSFKDGIQFDEELKLHNRGVRFIADVCEQLKLPSVTVYTAITYFTRFYLRYSHKQVHAFNVAGASIFLASKTEETSRRVKEVAASCTRIGLKKPSIHLDDSSKELNKWINVITYNEELLLEALYFDLDIKSPYVVLKSQLAKIGLESASELQSTALQYVNDSCKTLVQNVYPSAVLAASTILWASITLKFDLPNLDGATPWKFLGFDREKLVEVVNSIVDMLNVVRKPEVPEYERIE